MKTNHITKSKQTSISTAFWLTLIFVLFIKGPFGPFFTYARTSGQKINLSKLDKYIERSRQAYNVPGLAVAIVKDGKIILAKGYGLREFSKKENVDQHTLFAIASNTKAFTSAAVAMLEEEGKLDWDDKVRTFLPYFQLYDHYVSEEITVRDLLCHRSGLGTFSGDLLWYETPYSTVEVIKRAKYLKPKFPFRSGYGYSNIMFMAAGEVVHEASGMPYKDFITQRILKPLGMNRTCIGTDDLKGKDNVATPHYVPETGNPIIVPYTSSDCAAGAAAINSSVYDMAQWLNMLLNNGKVGDKQILTEDSLEEVWTPNNSFKVSRYTKELSPTTNFSAYGLGWGIRDFHGQKVISHGGGLDGMISRVMLVPGKSFGFVILTNSINGVCSPLSNKIMDTMMGTGNKDWTSYFLERRKKRLEEAKTREAEKKKEETPKPLPKFQLELTQYEGTYGGPMYGDAEVKLVDGKLVLNILPAPVFISDLTPLHYDTFELKLRNTFSFIAEGKGTVQFLRDKTGTVVEMVVDIPNNDFWFTELEFKKRMKK